MMGENSKIEWTDHTFNPWLGCAKVSEACRNCYAESWAKRTGNAQLWRGERRRTTAGNWRKPVRWNEQAEAAGVRARVFCASLADVFEDRGDLVQHRADLWALIRASPWLDWLLLTKRPENILGRDMIPEDWGPDGYPNVWLGTTVEHQDSADQRIPYLLEVPAPVRFLSCEPMVGRVSLAPFLADQTDEVEQLWGESLSMLHVRAAIARGVQWVIAGGESGGGARASDPEWFRLLRDECNAADVPFHFKQWGEHDAAGCRVGKVKAGRLLDGVEHNGLPQP